MSKVADIEKQLRDAQEECAELRKELTLAKQTEASYTLGKETGKQLVAMKKGLIDSGLTECQAWQITMEALKAAL